jgi:hypothetical protein
MKNITWIDTVLTDEQVALLDGYFPEDAKRIADNEGYKDAHDERILKAQAEASFTAGMERANQLANGVLSNE